MWWAAKQLLVPLRYLRIRHGSALLQSKKTIDFILPLIFAAATLAVFWWLGIRLAIFAHQELVKRIGDLLALMIVFYMAALAAVATFDRKGIDDRLEGEDALLRLPNPAGGEMEDKPLSYRQFISYLFGYLSLLSLLLYLFLAVMSVGWPKFEEHFDRAGDVHWTIVNIADPVLFFVMFFALWQLMFTSLLGIYFLTERIQTLHSSEKD